MINMGCVLPSVDHHHGMLAATLTPIAIALFLHARFVHNRRKLAQFSLEAGRESLPQLEQAHYSLLLVLAYVVFPDASKSVFQTFA